MEVSVLTEWCWSVALSQPETELWREMSFSIHALLDISFKDENCFSRSLQCFSRSTFVCCRRSKMHFVPCTVPRCNDCCKCYCKWLLQVFLYRCPSLEKLFSWWMRDARRFSANVAWGPVSCAAQTMTTRQWRPDLIVVPASCDFSFQLWTRCSELTESFQGGRTFLGTRVVVSDAFAVFNHSLCLNDVKIYLWFWP